jgi:AcrR family transcriptional regulator
VLACAVAFFAVALVAGASAGEYHVYSCRTPAGESAPADGWSGSAGPAYSDVTKDTCGEGGALTAALGDVTIHEADVDEATWTFSTPTFDAMLGASLWRAADADGGAGVNATYETWLAGPSEESLFDGCVYVSGCTTGHGEQAQPLSAANRLVVPAANLGAHMYLNATCEGGFSGSECPPAVGDANGYAAAVYLYAADILLEQTAGPTADNVAGELAIAPVVSGTSDVTFSASDPGSGVWETTFSIDGKVVQSTVPNENGGRCRNVGQSTDGLAAFLYLQPCLPSESVDVPFNTTAVSNGEHHLVVDVLDPAGNSAPVLDREINVENPVPGQTSVGAAKPVVQRAVARRVDPQGREAAGGRGAALTAWAVAEVRPDPHGRPGAFPCGVPLYVSWPRPVADPGALRSGSRISVCRGVVERGAGAGGVRAGAPADVRRSGRDRRGTAQHARMSELQRGRVLAAAVEVLEELGYRGITVAELVARAGVSRKTFYEHFEDREGCFVAALEDLAALEGESLGSAREAGGARVDGRDPAGGLGGRVTYRTLRVLAAVAELGGGRSHPSNREVAEHAGIADQGQIARMLARLEGLGVVERDGGAGRTRPVRGEANARRQTDWGVEVRAAVEGRAGRS